MSAGPSVAAIGDVATVPGVARHSATVDAAMLAVAVVAGALYSLSPLTVWSCVWMALLFRWAVAGTDPSERRWLLAILGLALGLRLVAIGLLPFLVDPKRQAYTTYFGDALYAIQRSIWIRNVFLGVPVAARDYIEAFEPVFGWSGYNYVLAYLHVLFGPSPYGIALVSTGLFLTASVMLYRLCRDGFGPVAAFGGLAVLLFLPSWFAWSVAPLKEAMQFFLLTSAIGWTIALVTGRWPVKACAMAGIAVAILVSGTLRNGGAEIAAAGTGLGAMLWLATRRWWVVAALVLLLPLAAAQLSRNPQVRVLTAATVTQAAARHIGHIRTPGSSYRLLDDKFYIDPEVTGPDAPLTLTFAEGARFLISSVGAFLTMPLPWDLESAGLLVIVPQQVVWYAAILLSVFGAAAGVRRDPLLTFMLVGIIVAAVVVIAPNSGNIGTLIRHRDMVVPFVCALAGIGGVTVAQRLLAGSITQLPNSSMTRLPNSSTTRLPNSSMTRLPNSSMTRLPNYPITQ